MADQDPVLVYQVVGGDVGVGSSESLLQGVSLKGGHHMMLCKSRSLRRLGSVQYSPLRQRQQETFGLYILIQFQVRLRFKEGRVYFQFTVACTP